MFSCCNFALFLLLLFCCCCSFRGTLAGRVGFTTCENDGTFTLDYLDIEGCTGTEPCPLNGGRTYWVEFSGCTRNRGGQQISAIPYHGDAYFLLPPLGTSFVCGDLCKNFTTNSATTSCPVAISANGVTCGTWTLQVSVPCYLGLPEPLPLFGVPLTARAAAWVNRMTGKPVMCIQLPVQYFLC